MCHSFHTKKKLTVHIKVTLVRILGPRIFINLASVTKEANLTVHIRPHTGYKPYQCSQCESDLAKKKS